MTTTRAWHRTSLQTALYKGDDYYFRHANPTTVLQRFKPLCGNPTHHYSQDNIRALDWTLEALRTPAHLPSCPHSLTFPLQLPHWE